MNTGSGKTLVSLLMLFSKMNGEWLKKLYGKDVPHSLITVQAPMYKGNKVNISDNTKVLDQNMLDLLKLNLVHFTNGIISSGFKASTKEQVAKLLKLHNLIPENFRANYLKKILSN